MAEFLFSDLRGEIDVPGINDLAVIRCVRLAARYFCRETGFLTIETSPLVDIVSGQASYTIPADPLGRAIVRALEVWVGDQKLASRSSDQFDREVGAPREHVPWTTGHSNLTFSAMESPWRLATEYPPQFYFQERPDTVRLVGIPDQSVTTTLRIVSSVQPAFTHESVDEFIVNTWGEILTLGAKGYLLQMPQKGWTNFGLGAATRIEFEKEVAVALADSVAGYAANSEAVGRVRAYP